MLKLKYCLHPACVSCYIKIVLKVVVPGRSVHRCSWAAVLRDGSDHPAFVTAAIVFAVAHARRCRYTPLRSDFSPRFAAFDAAMLFTVHRNKRAASRPPFCFNSSCEPPSPALRIPTIQTRLTPIHQHQSLRVALGAERGTGREAGGIELGFVVAGAG